MVGVANFGQAAPAIGLIVLFAILFGYGFWTAIVALVVYGVLPVLSNTIVGLQGVSPTLVEAGSRRRHVQRKPCCCASSCRWPCR